MADRVRHGGAGAESPFAISEHDRLIAWGDELTRIHNRLRDALALAREAIESADGADPGDRATRELLLYCRGFCAALSGHHRGEDAALFPELLAARPDLAPVIAQLSRDHSMIDHLLAGLETAVESGAGTQERLRHLDGVEAVMETHFRYEEKKLISVLNAAALPGSRHGYLGPLAE
ncbi:hemerythrin domain-containing protein [Allonocardiopsis opalescens]|uniref:Hemerythrin HHE cation binding domain-containing protein n=1 Tax=Allonocardiopsis opalescens TaxID=1144618 RepID=A0A2T0Q1M2_9ACTN|nr:hemerythrin domain-containing protein [Allonocardiopsis opalescens]PRX97671.1 hemerythrin HHE cation binding domain-containing protein [Allonocardiopsis opalescens]